MRRGEDVTRLSGNGRSRTRPGASRTRSLVEIVVMLAASTIMALMVAVGGVAAERLTPVGSMAIERPAPDRAPLLPNETS
jgi:hypothetical protein